MLVGYLKEVEHFSDQSSCVISSLWELGLETVKETEGVPLFSDIVEYLPHMLDATGASKISKVGDSDGFDDRAVLNNAVNNPFVSLIVVAKLKAVALNDDFDLRAVGL